MAPGENPGAGSPREPYQQLVRTIVAEISDRLPLEAFYSVVIAHEGKTFVAAMVQLEGQPPQTATIDYEDEHRTLFYELFWQEVALTGQGGPTQLYAASFAPKSNSFVYHGSHPYDPAQGMPDAAALQRFAQRLQRAHAAAMVDAHLYHRSAMKPAFRPSGAHLTEELFTILGQEIHQQAQYFGADWAALNVFFAMTSGPEGTQLEQVDAIFYMENLSYIYGVFSRAALEPFATAYIDAVADGKPFHHAQVQITVNRQSGEFTSSVSWDDWAERIRTTAENWRDVANDTHPLMQRQP